MVEIDGQPWFVALDVFTALGYAKGSRTYHINLLGTDEVRVLKIQTRPETRNMKLISESGLYKLVMRSDKPAARKFQDWVTRSRLATPDVLPAIRKAEA